LKGSSCLKLPRAFAWAVGNANYHHVHHLSAKIPNYHLRAAHEQQAIFAHTPVVTVRSSIDALRLKLWDEERGCLVRYPARRARSAAAPGLLRAAGARDAMRP
jgi:acyl-lipid omega-6 desaturase (Delta-12 desaturase)